MARPMLFVVLAASAPLLLYPAATGGAATVHVPTRLAWLHVVTSTAAVVHARSVPVFGSQHVLRWQTHQRGQAAGGVTMFHAVCYNYSPFEGY